MKVDAPSGGNAEADDGTAAVSDENLRVALPSIESMSASIDALAGWAAAGVPSLSAGQFDRARNVLAHAAGQVAAGLRASAAARVRGLYVIVDPEATRGRPILDVAEAALRGGASVVQLRDKSRDKGEMLPDALRLQAMCEDYGGLFVVNDDADLARAVSSHALHVGQTDLPVASARAVLDARQLVGTSNGGVVRGAPFAGRRGGLRRRGRYLRHDHNGQERTQVPGRGRHQRSQRGRFDACSGDWGHQPGQHCRRRSGWRRLRLRG